MKKIILSLLLFVLMGIGVFADYFGEKTKYNINIPTLNNGKTFYSENYFYGTVKNGSVKKVYVNGHKLENFNGNTWRYCASMKNNTFGKGINIYKIRYEDEYKNILNTDFITIEFINRNVENERNEKINKVEEINKMRKTIFVVINSEYYKNKMLQNSENKKKLSLKLEKIDKILIKLTQEKGRIIVGKIDKLLESENKKIKKHRFLLSYIKYFILENVLNRIIFKHDFRYK